MLDLWQDNANVDAGFDPAREGNAMPEGFGDSFDAAWHEGQLFGSSIAQGNSRQAALDQYLGEIQRSTGKKIDYNPEGGADPWQLVNDAGEKLGIKPLPDDEIDRRAAAISGDAHRAYTAEREQTFGGRVGSALGSLASGTVDPVNMVGLAVAPEAELGVLSTAAVWGGIGAGSQGLNEAIQAPFREQVQPGYAESGQAASNILGGGIGGAVLGGGFKAAGAAWTRVKTGDWPRSIRDAGNIVESEAQVHESNILPGAEGVAAHTEALSKSIDDIVAGRAVQAPESVTAVPEPQPGGIVAYHGTPHDFDVFSMDKIGTGEGAQAYGHGLYFAENEKIAGWYREKLAPEKGVFQTSGPAAGLVLPGKDVEQSNIYRVRINAEREHFLDWDIPISEQNAVVQKAVESIAPLGITGEQLVKQFGDREALSELLSSAGVPGIKYLDRSSRTEGEGSRNFVVFDDRDVQITHKNGKPLSLFESNEAKIDQMMDERGAAAGLSAAAKDERATSGELPFAATAKEAQADQHAGSLAGHLEGFGMTADDASDLADRVIAAKSDDEARAILTEAMARPQTIADTVPSVSEIAKADRAAKAEVGVPLTAQDRAAALADPKAEQAMTTELERLRDSGQGGMIPTGVDEKGEPTYRLLDEAIQDAKNDRDAADQIESCINPPVEAAE